MSGKLSKERLKEMRHVGKSVRCSNMHGQFVAEELFDHIDLIESEKQSLTAENERLTRELHDSKTAATEEAAAHDEARKQLADCQQRLAALAVDPADKVKLGEMVREGFNERGAKIELGPMPDWHTKAYQHIGAKLFAAGRLSRAPEVSELERQLAEARKWEGQYKRLYENCDASHEKTLKQLAEATNRLAELTKPADAIELRKIAWANYGAIYAQQKGEPLEPYESSTPERRARIDKAADAVAARVRAPLLEQIAELTAKLEAAEVKSRDDENELVGRQAIIIGLTEGVQAMQADRGRLAAELATTKQALAAMTDERDRARDMLRQAEASSEATQQSLAAARGEVERLRNPVAIAVSEAIDEGLALGPSPSPAKAAASEPVGLCPKCGIQPLTKEGDDMIRLGEKDYLCGNCKRYLCRPIESKAAASEPDDSSHTPETAHTSSSQSDPASVWIRGQQYAWKFNGAMQYLEMPFALTAEEVRGLYASLQVVECGKPADHSGEANEKVEHAERRFVCPRCLSERLPRCYGQGEQVCATCGKVIPAAEVEAAKGDGREDELECTLQDEEAAHQDTLRLWEEAKQALADARAAEQTARELIGTAKRVATRLKAMPFASDREHGGMLLCHAENLELVLKTAPAITAASEPADHSGDAAEKVEPAERRFVCPRCGCEQYGTYPPYPFGPRTSELHYCANETCNWSGSVVDVLRSQTAEVEAAKGEREEQQSLECKIRKAYRGLNDPLFESAMDELNDVEQQLADVRKELAECESSNDEIYKRFTSVADQRDEAVKELDALKQQLAAANQAREAAEKSRIRIMRSYDPNCDEFVEADEIEKMQSARQSIEALQKLAEELGKDPEGCLVDVPDDALARIEAAETAKQDEVYLRGNQLAAISTVLMANTPVTLLQARLPANHALYTPAFQDAVRAVEREIGLRQRAEGAEAAAAAGKALAGKIRDALCSVEAIAHIERALADYDQALPQGEQRGEGQHGR